MEQVSNRIAAARAKVEELKTRLEHIAEKDVEDDEEEPHYEVYQQIDRVYWEICRQVLDQITQGELVERLEFPAEVDEMLSFGYLGLGCQGFVRESIDRSRRFDAATSEVRVIWLPQALDESYRKLLLVEELKRLKAEREETVLRIQNYPSRMGRLFEGLLKLVEQTVTNAATAEKARVLYSEWYNQLEDFVRMERQVKEGGLSTGEERRRYIDLKEKDRRYLAETDEILQGFPLAMRARQVVDAMIEETSTVVSMDKRLETVTKELETRTAEAQAVTGVTIKVALEEEIAYFQSMARMCAKWAKIPPQSIPLAERRIAEPAMIIETLGEIVAYDPGLFSNKVVKRRGVPTVLILPAMGNGKYDWKNNRFLIPSQFPRTILESLASAAINYRDDVDRQSGDREMLNSFKDTKEIRDIRSSIKIQNKLMEEYVNWIVKESAGYQVMEKDTREWFEEHIGPDKNDVKAPLEYHAIGIKEINAEIERLEALPDDADKFHRLACVISMKNRRDQEEQEAALRHAEKAVEMNPTAPDYIYTVGVLYKRTRKKKRAAEMFRKYTQVAPQSWWSRKAQEHLVGF